MSAVVELADAGLAFPGHPVWSGLDLTVEAGQFVTVLGPNGAGKSSLLKVLLGVLPLTSGAARILGGRVRRGDRRIGYVPQQHGLAPDVPLRGRDLVRLGVDGHRWGPVSGREAGRRADAAMAAVGVTHLATRRIGPMSGGEQQRLRVAQALAGEPELLLCDEPLLSLDLRNQQHVVRLLDQRRREHGTAVLFVTHELNPVLPVTDRVLYLTGGRFRLGRPEEVMTSEVLSELYQAPVEVLHRHGRIITLGVDDAVRAGLAHGTGADEGHHHADHGPGVRAWADAR